jgi:opacity protein-like surface antigen
MKTITLFFFFLFALTLTAHAQITKGNWMVGGDVAFSYSEGKSDTKSESFTMRGSPNIGYFFFNKIALGTKVDYTFSQSKSANVTSKFDRLFVSPFARYYFLKPEKPINVFLESAYGFSILNNNNATVFSINGGVAIFLNSSVALEVSLEYLNTNSKDNYVGSNTILLGFGIQVHLEREK